MATSLCIFSDRDIITNLKEVQRTWDSNESFIVVPQKSGLTQDHLEKISQLMMRNHARGHFALTTSGSTGEFPQVIIGQKDRAVALTQLLDSIQENTFCQNTIVSLPLSYSFAFINQLVWSHVHRKNLVLTPGLQDVNAFITALENFSKSMVCMVRSQVPIILQYARARVFPHVQKAHFAGDTFPLSNMEALKQLFPNAGFYNNYGCTEALPRLAVRKVDSTFEANVIGLPLPGVEFHLTTSSELQFSSPYSAVAKVDGFRIVSLLDGPIPTGDIAELSPRGEWKILGRRDAVFKRHGEKVVLSSLLTAVEKSMAREVHAYKDNDSLGQPGYILAFAGTLQNRELRELLLFFQRNYKRVHWPLRIVTVREFPRLENKKLDLLRLKGDELKKDVLWHQHL